MLSNELSDLDYAKAKQLEKQGRMEDGFALYYAMNEGFLGIGTDDDLLKEKLKGKSKEEIEQLKKDYAAAAKKFGNVDKADLVKDVQGETSGRAGHELDQSLKGNPTTIEEMRQRAAEDYAFERTESSWVGEVGIAVVMGPFGYMGAKSMGIQPTDIANGLTDMWSGSGKTLDKTHADVEAKFLAIKQDPKYAGYDKLPVGSPERAAMDKAMMAELQGTADWQAGDLKGFQEAKDATADAAGTAVALAVGAVITVASGGTAAPALVALLSGLAGVGAQMMIKGGAMSNEEIVQKTAAVIAEACAAGIVKIEAVEAFVKNVGKLGAGNKLIAKMLEEAMEEAIESGSEELMNALMDPELYKGDFVDFAKGVSQKTGKAMFTGAFAGGIAGGAGEYMPDGKTWKGRAVKGAASQAVGAVATSAIDPSSYEGSQEDKWKRFGQGVGEASLKGVCDSMGSHGGHHGEGHADVHGGTDTHADTKVDAHGKTDTHTSTNTNTNANTATDTHANTAVDTKADTNTNPAVDTKTDTNANPAVDTKTDTNANPAVDTKTDTNANPAVDTKTDTNANPAVDTKIDPTVDAEAKHRAAEAEAQKAKLDADQKAQAAEAAPGSRKPPTSGRSTTRRRRGPRSSPRRPASRPSARRNRRSRRPRPGRSSAQPTRSRRPPRRRLPGIRSRRRTMPSGASCPLTPTATASRARSSRPASPPIRRSRPIGSTRTTTAFRIVHGSASTAWRSRRRSRGWKGLPPAQAAAEAKFAAAYERDPQAMAKEYLAMVMAGKTDAEMKNFATDDAKLLSPDYNPTLDANATDQQKADALAARGMMNIATHQTANAVAKMAFTMRLDQIQADPGAAKTILVTAGGVGAGKSYSIDNNPQAAALKASSSAVWDAAGEQNSTELPWVIAEAKKRGIEVAVVYVHKRPEQSWENMKFGVIPRASKSGRMVDARLHADSYAEGARNFDAIQKSMGADASVKFVVLDATGEGQAQQIDALPKSALELDAAEVHARNVAFLDSKADTLPKHVVEGGNKIGEQVWGPAAELDEHGRPKSETQTDSKADPKTDQKSDQTSDQKADEAVTSKPGLASGVEAGNTGSKTKGPAVEVVTTVATVEAGQELMRRLVAGDKTVLAQLGFQHDGATDHIEWGLGQTSDGKIILVRGESGAVDFDKLPGNVKALAHSHPAVLDGKSRDLKAAGSANGVAIGDLMNDAHQSDLVKFLPSTGDLAYFVDKGIGQHTVFTPYVHLGNGQVGNPTGPNVDPKQRIEIEVLGAKAIGRSTIQPHQAAYEAQIVIRDGAGNVLWTGPMQITRLAGQGFSMDSPTLSSKFIDVGQAPTAHPDAGPTKVAAGNEVDREAEKRKAQENLALADNDGLHQLGPVDLAKRAPLHSQISQMDSILAHTSDHEAIAIIRAARAELHHAEQQIKALDAKQGSFANLDAAELEAKRIEILKDAHTKANAALAAYDMEVGNGKTIKMTEAEAEAALKKAHDNGEQQREVFSPTGRAYEILDPKTKRVKYVIEFDAHVDSKAKSSPETISANKMAAEMARQTNKTEGLRTGSDIERLAKDGHLEILLDRVIAGTGLAAAQDAHSLTKGDNSEHQQGIPKTIGIGTGEDTFEKLGDIPIGQKVVEYDSPNWSVQPRDFTDNHEDYTSGKNLADATQLTQRHSGVPVVPFEIMSVSVKKDASWKVQNANVRIQVMTNSGPVYLYAMHTDLAVGLGAPRQLDLSQVNANGDQVEAKKTLQKLEQAGLIVYGEDPNLQKTDGDILISGGSATASWNARFAQMNGANVDWVAPDFNKGAPRMITPQMEYRKLQKDLASGTLTADEAIKAHARMSELRAFGDAMLPSNLEPSHASFKNPNIPRSVAVIESVTPTDDGRVLVTFKGGTPDPKIYNQVVVSHGTDPNGPEGRTKGALGLASPGNGRDVGPQIEMKPKVVNGKVVALESVNPPGAVRVIGAAMWNGAWANAMTNEADKKVFNKALQSQADTAPRDSPANVLVHNVGQQIADANKDATSEEDLDAP
ncbi:MAG: hypothetical protein IPQ07_07100 [Myxococcales bacterium]|nr:hypothetical protein [Myxococcales bacterium]